MSLPAVEFDGVSKRYQLNHFRTTSLKERISERLTFFGAKSSGDSARPQTEDFWALNNVSFAIQPGETVGIIGPNGSGKSTSLKILSNVIQPTSGRVAINGRLGALIEVGAGFHPELSGRENVFLNGSILGMKKAEIKSKFDSIVDFAEIEQFIDTPVKHYSSGMYVRLGFAIAIHNQPDVMLIDEILAVGDLSFQRKCFEKITEMKNAGRTILLVSHSMSQVQSVCERAILLHKGVLISDGPVDRVAEEYFKLSNNRSSPTAAETTLSSALTIRSVNLVNARGAALTETLASNPLIFDIEYVATKKLVNPTFILILRVNGIRVYSSNTGVLAHKFGTLEGSGTLRCEIGELPLLPNDFEMDLQVYDEHQQDLLAKHRVEHAFTVAAPANPLELGCRVPQDAKEHGMIFKRAQWTIVA